MSPQRRNFVVGVTVLGSLLILGWMMLKFGNAPAKWAANRNQIAIHFISDRGDGVSEGAQLFYRGVAAGRVTALHRSENNQQVMIDAEVDNDPPLPANLEGRIRFQGLIGGGAAISLELVGDRGPDLLLDIKPVGKLAAGATLPATFVGLDILPKEFAELATELRKTSKELRDAKLVTHLDEAVRSAGDVMKNLNSYVGDPKLKDDVATALANLKQASETATRVASNAEKFSVNIQQVSTDASDAIKVARTRVDELGKQLGERLLQVSKLLDGLNSVVAKIDAGEGTAGKLVNDPRLYENLNTTARELNVTVTDLKRLVEQWEQEGVSLKLK